MNELLSRMLPGEFIGLVAVVMGCGIGLSAVIGGFWYGARKAETEATLKRELVAAGMSAEDIERVVNVTAGGATAAELAKARTAAQVEIVKARGF